LPIGLLAVNRKRQEHVAGHAAPLAAAFAAGTVANRFGYPAAFMMAATALGVAAITGKFVFPAEPALAGDAEEILDVAGS
jgi:hypothetical protein